MRILIIIFLSFFLLAAQEADAASGEKIYQKKCLPCHGESGEGLIGPAIGCNGVKNKSDGFLYEVIYFGRKGDHGIDMPSWGKGDSFLLSKEAIEFKKILKDSKQYSSQQITGFVEKIYGNHLDLVVRENKEVQFVKELGFMTPEEINQVIKYIRHLEKEQKKHPPEECIADKTSFFKGSSENGKKRYIEKCIKCHGNDGKGDSFFEGKDLMPRDFTDRLYMNSKTDTYLKAVLKSGGLKAGRSAIMSPASLSNKEIKNVITYIRTFSR